MFRPKKHIDIPDLLIPASQQHLILSNSINSKQINQSLILTHPKEKVDIFGSHFASIYNRDIKSNIKHSIDEKIKKIENKMCEFGTICSFNSKNKSDNPNSEYFMKIEETEVLFKELNNKRSSGEDEIPNIILRKLPSIVIQQYNKLLNNMLNNCTKTFCNFEKLNRKHFIHYGYFRRKFMNTI